MSDWTTTRAAMAADRQRLAAALGRKPSPLHRGLWALRLYRVATWLRGRGLKLPARLLWAANIVLTGADLDSETTIGPGAVIPLPWGVILSGTIGANCTIGARTGVGGLLRVEEVAEGVYESLATVGDDVTLGADVMVLGVIRIGDRSRIGDGCMMMDDIPAGAVLVSHPVDWRAMRVHIVKRDLPPPAKPGLFGCIRTDVARAVIEYGGTAAMGAARFWGHLILPGVAGVVLFRIGQSLHGRGWRRLAALVARLVHGLFGMTLHPGSVIGPGLHVPHPVGVRFCGRAGANLTLYPHASAGPESWPSLHDPLPAACPEIGAQVRLGAQSRVIGPVRIGDDATAGVNAILRRDLAAERAAVPRRNWRNLALAQPEGAEQPE